jgi:von Willebrand factor type A domain
VNRTKRLALLACIAILSLRAMAQAASTNVSTNVPAANAAGEQRPGALDVVLLLDKSLSMAPFFNEVKEYAAGKVLGPILVPGDRLVVELVYGKVERLISMTIATEDDKAKAIRALRGVKADGRYTDLGAALDAAKRDLDELGQPDRPKYVLLISDERQEAPKGSPYQASDYKLKHPSLEYVKRVDLGKFRAITVGLQVGAKVEQTAPTVMELLMDPPVRNGAFGEDIGQGSGQTPASAGQAGPGGPAAATSLERALPAWLLYGAAGLLVLALAGFIAVFLVSRKKKKEEVAQAE